MSEPILSPEDAKIVQKEKIAKAFKVKSLQDAAKASDAITTKWTTLDNAFKAKFDWYHNIISKYDDERKAIDGTYPTNVVTELDLQNVAATPPTGRLVPIPPATNILRPSDAFDGSSTANLPNDNETYFITMQTKPDSIIKLGPRWDSGTQPTTTPSLATTTAITPASTSVSFTVTNPAENPVFAIGNKFVIHTPTAQVCIEVTGVTQAPGNPAGSCTGETPPGSGIDQPTCLLNGGTWNPPTNYTAVVQFVFLEGCEGSVAIGAQVDKDWAGFSDASRVAENDTVDGYNNLMTNLTNRITYWVNQRLTKVNAQIAANVANEDPDKASTTLPNLNADKALLDNWLLNTIIGDADQGANKGLSSLRSERVTRAAQLGPRVTEITSSYNGHPNKWYDLRYTVANNRANLSGGSIREISNSQNVKATMNKMAAGVTDSIAALNSL